MASGLTKKREKRPQKVFFGQVTAETMPLEAPEGLQDPKECARGFSGRMNRLPAAADSYQRLGENALQQILRRLEHQKKWSPKRWQPTCDVDAAAAGGKLFTSFRCIIYLAVNPSVDDALSIVCPSVYTAYVSVH